MFEAAIRELRRWRARHPRARTALARRADGAWLCQGRAWTGSRNIWATPDEVVAFDRRRRDAGDASRAPFRRHDGPPAGAALRRRVARRAGQYRHARRRASAASASSTRRAAMPARSPNSPSAPSSPRRATSRRGHDALRRGEWRGDLYRADMTGEELSEMTVGVIGYGAIGTRVVQAPQGLRLPHPRLPIPMCSSPPTTCATASSR